MYSPRSRPSRHNARDANSRSASASVSAASAHTATAATGSGHCALARNPARYAASASAAPRPSVMNHAKQNGTPKYAATCAP